MPPRGLLACLLGLLLCHPAIADEAASSHAGDFWTRDVLTGDWDGQRSGLEDSGILLGIDSIDETFGNVSGGTRIGAVYEGRLEVLATLNLDKLVQWDGATLAMNAYQIRGRGLSANDLGNNLMTASNIEATRATRLFHLYFEQALYDGKLSIRAGQIAADDEFFVSQSAANFLNATFGWPALMSSNLPSGGPAYPLATPGVRLSYAASDNLSFLAAAFNGDPAGAGSGNPELRDASGTAFRFDDAAFLIGEASYATNQDKDAPGLPATYKLGAWLHTGTFADQRLDNSGRSLASPASSGIARRHRADGGLYAVIDQEVWRAPEVDNRTLDAFLRIGGDRPDRNLVTLYADSGLNFKGMITDRAADIFGVAFAVARIGSGARALDADAVQFSGLATPIRDVEAVAELTYRCQLTPWWSLQPDVQFIRHPGGGIALPSQPAKPIPDAVVLGLRSALLF